MGRFDHLATRPIRGPRDILRWKVLDAIAGRNRKDPGGYTTPRREPDRSLVDGSAAQLTWIGHASFLLTLGGKRTLVDPIFRHRLGPVARLAPPGLAIDALPPVDVVLITHNHRDHLDPWSLRRLGPAPQYVVPPGTGAPLVHALPVGSQRCALGRVRTPVERGDRVPLRRHRVLRRLRRDREA